MTQSRGQFISFFTWFLRFRTTKSKAPTVADDHLPIPEDLPGADGEKDSEDPKHKAPKPSSILEGNTRPKNFATWVYPSRMCILLYTKHHQTYHQSLLLVSAGCLFWIAGFPARWIDWTGTARGLKPTSLAANGRPAKKRYRNVPD